MEPYPVDHCRVGRVVDKKPLILAIVGCCVGSIPLLGAVAGLVLCIIAYCLGKRAQAAANARPDRSGIVVAVIGRWIGFGGIIQNIYLCIFWPLWLFVVICAQATW